MTKQYKGRTATIEIDEKNVIIKSSGFFSSSKKTIPLRDIKNVELSASSFFSKDTVEIYYGSMLKKSSFPILPMRRKQRPTSQILQGKTDEHLHLGNSLDLPHRYLELAYLLPPP